jgi:hypothetical protein
LFRAKCFYRTFCIVKAENLHALGLITLHGEKTWQDNLVDKSDNWVDSPY